MPLTYRRFIYLYGPSNIVFVYLQKQRMGTASINLSPLPAEKISFNDWASSMCVHFLGDAAEKHPRKLINHGNRYSIIIVSRVY